ncbi:hypothetical protein EA658_09975 [Pseudoxanthomonas winnipegensis]|uniref:Helix-turn-helix domain-containing protein n=1 Tax=Pseudoxanthomonas winnipegensis TaxID=2480810 RepID=A0ABY1WCV0_9GAMM|nr:hypothetical protein EA659_03675 [Pseudoxanthomonas winnipegensis]TAA19193.1 hypothetical protein EA658_09975 [Pseudoxanthomonas winnipegensis]TAH70454.1 hypothetical protein EA657_17040 [Pseudoxanthomonas winnipegensis]
MAAIHDDAALIESLGGAAAVARLLGFTGKGSLQRVHNWTTRGIPEVIRLRRQDVFGPAPPPAAEGTEEVA